MKIDESLNLVLPVTENVRAFHTPISKDVFEINYRILAATQASLTSKGIYYQMGTGPRIAALALKDEGRKDADERGEDSDGGVQALLDDIKRLTAILAPGENGFQYFPVDQAIKSGIIDEEDWEEVESAIVFFTCHYALTRKAARKAMVSATASVLKGASTSSSLSEYVASLPKLIAEENSGKKAESSGQS